MTSETTFLVRDVYKYIAHNITKKYNPKAASKFLRKLGFIGIHYYGKRDGECYVIFDENDAKIVKHTLYGISGTPTDDEKRIQDFQENIRKNGFNSVTLQQLNNLIKDIENGRELLLPKHRFAYERKIFGDRNRPRITRNAIAAALICGGGCVSNRIISTSYLKRYEWSERCEQLLEQWAKSVVNCFQIINLCVVRNNIINRYEQGMVGTK